MTRVLSPWFWLCLALCVPSLACAQQYSFRTDAYDEGLGDLSITSLALDASGFIWTGTENGVYRFDGRHFERMDPGEGTADSYISALQADTTGAIWVGTTTRLYRQESQRRVPAVYGGKPVPIWQGQNLVVLTPRVLLAVSRRNLLKFEPAANGSSWEGTDFFTAAQLVAHPQLTDIVSIQATPDGHLWMGCGKALCEYGSNGEITVWDDARGVVADHWGGLLIDRRGAVWARGQDHVIALEPGASRFTDRSFEHAAESFAHLFMPIIDDTQGRILTYTEGGISRWDGKSWQSIGPASGLRSDTPAALLFDGDGDLWLGSGGLGLFHWIGYRHWESWDVQQALSSGSIWTILRDHQGRLQIGTESGQGTLAPNRQSFIPQPQTANLQINSLAEDPNGGWWAGTFSGLLLRAPDAGRPLTITNRLAFVFFTFFDTEARLWIGTAKGLYVIERPAADTRAHRIDEMPAAAAASSTPGGCQSPDGTRWFISDAGLVRNKQGSWSLPRIAEFSPAPKLILISCARDNSLWLAGETPGVWHITMDEDVLHAHNILPADDPLNAKRILALQEDRRGWLWLATDSGIVIYDGQLWRLFDQDSGLVWNDCNQSALWEDTDGSIWIGTSRGLSHVMQPETLFSNSPLQARVIGISRGAESLSASTDFSLPWSDLPLVFKLAIPFYTDPHHLFFRYRLDGLEKEWVTTAQDELRYPALAGGDYHLEIVAEDAALRTHSPVTEIRFHIDSPWWLSWPFFVFSALVLASLSMLMYSWRIRNLRSRQHELEALVADRTRELEASKQQYLMLASRDGLTGLWNRRAIMELLDIAVEHSRINRLPLTVALVDLDYFKRVNDSHGHGSGDTVLCEAARRFQEGLDGKGSVGRYGGEEFLVIVPDLNLQEGVERVRHLHQGLSAKPIALDDGREIIVTCSIGLVFSDGFRHSPTFLVKLADQALYQAKDQGRNRSVFTDARALPAARSIFESGADT